ncbi:MAG: Obg family GTPase CgtA, partial [Nocardioidaceae bacterium]
LGHDFLRHVERCAALVHVVDCATIEPGRDPVTDLDVIENELERYGGLGDRPRIVALNKVDVPDAAEIAGFVRADLEGRGLDVYEVSASSHAGLRDLSFAMATIVRAARAAAPVAETTRIVLRPRAEDDSDFSVTRSEGRWFVRGEKPERWVRQTDFSNDEAIGFLADRLARIGIEDRLLELGAEPGDDIVIGEETNAVVFDFDPQVEAGAELLMGRRGEDERLDPATRRTNKQRRRDLAETRETEAAARAAREASSESPAESPSEQD